MFGFLIIVFEIRDLNLLTSKTWLSKRHNDLHFFFLRHPFKVIFRHTNSPRLLRPLPFIVYLLEHTPPLIIPPLLS